MKRTTTCFFVAHHQRALCSSYYEEYGLVSPLFFLSFPLFVYSDPFPLYIRWRRRSTSTSTTSNSIFFSSLTASSTFSIPLAADVFTYFPHDNSAPPRRINTPCSLIFYGISGTQIIFMILVDFIHNSSANENAPLGVD